MSEQAPKLASKKKLLVDKDSFFEAPRSTNQYYSNASFFDEKLYESDQYIPADPSAETSLGIHYFSASSEFRAKDKTRIVLGKNWDYRQRNPSDADPKNKEFSANWGAPKVFHESTIELDFCGDVFEVEEDYAQGKTGDTIEKIVLKCNLLHKHAPANTFENWIYYMKTGAITKSGKSYEPVILSARDFYDHYHESINPFTPAELEELEPAGKAFFADYKTYYNERIRSNLYPGKKYDFEAITGQNARIQNSLPNIYGFLRLLTNKELKENSFFDLSKIVSYMRVFYDTTSTSKLQQLYTDVLKKFPLESLISLYGVIGHKDMTNFWPPNATKIIEKIISLSFDNVDGNSLFSDYYNEYSHFISNDLKLNYGAGGGEGKTTQTGVHRIRALERIMSNLVFSPDTIKLMNKADQYKKYFPFYAEIEFTANIFTSLGDAMKQLFLTKFLSECVLNTITPAGHAGTAPNSDSYSFSWVDLYEVSMGTQLNIDFVDFTSESTFKNISTSNFEKSSIGYVKPQRRGTLDINNVLNSWIKSESIDSGHPGPALGAYFGPHASAGTFNNGDLRNYMSYFRDDFSEPININSDENVIFKKLFGTAFYGKIMDTYKIHKRSYRDIINGIPAYTEDLFYRIEKIRKNAGSDEEEVVQQILIPNTSELDVVKYIDTQLKYATYATYKYNVYVHRIVFGSRYRYEWQDKLFDPPAPGSPPVHLTGPAGRPWSKKANLASTSPLGNTGSNPALAWINDGMSMKENVPSTGKEKPKVVIKEPDNSDDSSSSGAGTGKATGGQQGGSNQQNGYNGDPNKDTGNQPTEPLEEVPLELASLTDVDFFATVLVKVSPSIQIIEDKIFSTPEIMILDKPPVIPDINIIPYRAINNRIKILITGATDRYRAKPVIMLDSDLKEFETIKAAQLSYDGKVEFGSDDPVKRFQIFRTRNKPKTYTDFELYEQINEEFYEEHILPNTKYYYTFRAIDAHGHVSNPTPVYEVELIDEKGAVKPIIRLVNMEPEKNKTNIKDCQKYIYLKPSLKQLYFSDSSEVDSVFSDEQKKKKYKMRLTSKGSGKKIDLNFSFSKKIDKEFTN